MITLGIFASGSGTNAENFCKYFAGHPQIRVGKIYTNNPEAGVIERAARNNVPSAVFSQEEIKDGRLVEQMRSDGIAAVILAGYMKLIPAEFIKAFTDRILNIHPALLPNYGGKGMYGDHVHKAVVANRETKSGITIHLVNEKYDEGRILFQAECDVTKDDTPESLAQKIHALEYAHYPEQAAKYLLDD